MWLKHTLILLSILIGTVLSYTYPYKNCCRWKPIHGPIGHPHPPKYITEFYHNQKRFPIYANPRPKPVYGPPHLQKPVPVYGIPQQNYIHHQEYNSFSNFQNEQFHPQHQNLVVPQMQSVFAHHKVIAASHDESKLPTELLNPFYKNPHVREALAKHSWIGPGEKPELFRETDRISRQRIFEVLSHAGLIRRR